MRCGHDGIAFLSGNHVRRDRAALHVEDVRRVFLHVVKEAQRCAQRARLIHQDADAQVHLEEGEAHLQPLFERKPHRVAGIVLAVSVGVTVDTDLVTILAAQQLPDRHAPCLARQIPQGDLHTRDTAALAGMAAELLDLVHDLVDIAGVFAQQAAFQHQRIGFA